MINSPSLSFCIDFRHMTCIPDIRRDQYAEAYIVTQAVYVFVYTLLKPRKFRFPGNDETNFHKTEVLRILLSCIKLSCNYHELKTQIIHSATCVPAPVYTFQDSEAQHITISPDIARGFRSGDCSLLNTHFNDSIKLNILNKEYETGKNEASTILGKFFTEHPPVSFEIKFESEKKDSKFAIAILNTRGNENYRVNIFFLKAGNKDVIHLLRIEKENESSF